MVNIIIIGGGAAGMMAAGQAASMGANVILLEKTKHLGNKIKISGKGRCNLTNISDIHDFIDHFNRDGRFLHQAFSLFFVDQLRQFFGERNIPLVTERGRRVFPASGKAEDVVAGLTSWLERCGVDIRYSSPVSGLIIEEQKVVGVRCRDNEIRCDGVILACGGASYPATGSSGDGYDLARSCGHRITATRPALIPLMVADKSVHALAGLDLKNVGVRGYVNGKRKISDFGEVGFTRFGVGGPIILSHSRIIVDWLRQGKKVTIALDLKPALDDAKLDNRLQRDFSGRYGEPIDSVLRGILPKKMVPAALFYCSLDGGKLAGEICSQERIRLRNWLKDFRMDISGHRPLSEAIVTAGGVKVKEVDPYTMESRLAKGLYLCGELLDIDGDTGGYNLQAAFSTGWVAGRSAAALTLTPQSST